MANLVDGMRLVSDHVAADIKRIFFEKESNLVPRI